MAVETLQGVWDVFDGGTDGFANLEALGDGSICDQFVSDVKE